ncbi:hypothetical protein [Actinoallomurus acaciae]|uniref:Uncharacterized protein n=1 Tax=Actinoallomurus acaciae TaxID=502577 RepID=A0ABV5YP36_9ACTN
MPSQATLSRILTRNNLIIPDGRGVLLVDGRELKLISGIDDHSHFIVIAAW